MVEIDWDDFRKYCIAQIPIKTNTFSNRKRYLLHLVRNGVDIDSPDSVYDYLADRISRGAKGHQLNSYIKALNIYYKYKKHGHYFKLYRSYEKPVKIPLRKDIASLLSNCGRSKQGKLVKTMIFLFCHTGLRNKELCGLTFDNIDWQHNEIRLVGKWDRPRVIPVKKYVLHGRQVPSLNNYVKYHRYDVDSKNVFVTRFGSINPKIVRDEVKKVARRCGIGWVHPHSFRHFYATTLLSKGVNIKVVQVLLGHGNIRETSRYLHASELDIRRAIDDIGFDSLLLGDVNGFNIDFFLTNILGGI